MERSKLDLARQITPGKRAPTITQLVGDDWVAVNVMVAKKDIAVVMDDLAIAGAHDILVTDIVNTRAC